MKQRIILFALFAIVAAGTFSSCSDTKTYAEELSDEKTSVKDFMTDHGYSTTSTRPTTIPYPNGVFYKDSLGLYVHVIDTGTCIIDSIPTNTPIEVRYVEVDMAGDTTYMNMYSQGSPVEILYGNIDSSVSWGDCKAWHNALRYVGNGGHVELIVTADIGMPYYTTTSSLNARYYELRYKFWDPIRNDE